MSLSARHFLFLDSSLSESTVNSEIQDVTRWSATERFHAYGGSTYIMIALPHTSFTNSDFILGDYTMSYSIMKDKTIILHEPGREQMKVLNQYRLTEVFRDAYGNHMLNNWPQGTAVKNAVSAVKKFKGWTMLIQRSGEI